MTTETLEDAARRLGIEDDLRRQIERAERAAQFEADQAAFRARQAEWARSDAESRKLMDWMDNTFRGETLRDAVTSGRIQLKPGVTIEEVEADLRRIVAGLEAA